MTGGLCGSVAACPPQRDVFGRVRCEAFGFFIQRVRKCRRKNCRRAETAGVFERCPGPWRLARESAADGMATANGRCIAGPTALGAGGVTTTC